MNKKIYLVTGKVQSGKTTRLFEFIKNKRSTDGLLAPIVNGKRKLFHISSKELKDLEVNCSDNSTISVGKYHFLKEAFKWGNAKLLESYSKEPEWLIIDEVGKLELVKKGLEPAITEIINSSTEKKTKIILVIREYLVEEVLQMYNLIQQDVKKLNI